MAKKNSATSNIRRQRNAEKRAKKQAQKQRANAREARIARNILASEAMGTNFCFGNDAYHNVHKDERFVVAFFSTKDGEYVTRLESALDTVSDREIIEKGYSLFRGIGCDDCCIGVKFPKGTTISEARDKAFSEAWKLLAKCLFDIDPKKCTLFDAEGYGSVSDECVEYYCGWVEKCGEVPSKTGDVAFDLDSSAIKHVNYNDISHTLRLTFPSGNVYEYDDVPKDTFFSLVNAPSAGKFFNASIRDVYAYQRVA